MGRPSGSRFGAGKVAAKFPSVLSEGVNFIDIDALRARIRAMQFVRGSPEQKDQWRDDLDEARSNLAIENMPLDGEDDALFAMMLEEGLSPAMMVTVIQGFYKPTEH